MLTAYIDESYQHDHYYVGTVVCGEANYSRLQQELAQLRALIRTKFGMDPLTPIEFHGSCIMQGKKEWKPLKGKTHEAIWVFREVFRAVTASQSAVMFEGVDIPRLNARYTRPHRPYDVTMRHLLERVDERCEKANKQITVVADMIDRSDEVKRIIEGYATTGTPGFRPSRLAYINQPISYADSADSDGIQAADMVTYMHRRFQEEHDAHPRAKKAARQLMGDIQPLIAHSRKWLP